MSDQKNLAFAVASWLQSASKESSGEQVAHLQTAADSVAKGFSIDISDPAQKAQYGGGPGLEGVWDVFTKTQAKMGGNAPASSAQPAKKDVPPDVLAKAEALKGDGNKAMSSKDYDAAIAAYSQAIELNSASPVYFSNRSAAYAQAGQLEKAIEDAREASKVDPNFGKAYSRLGHALFSAGRYQEAVDAYQKGVEVDPTNKLMKDGLATAKQHVSDRESSSQGATSPTRDVETGAGAGAGTGGFPGMGGGGGMPDLGSLMNNPMLAQMAQNLMSNGGMEQMMSNPMIQQMMQRFGGGGGSGGGGMPDINAMMQDPQMREMARSMMGGAGGAGAGGGNRGGSGGSGSSNGDNNNMFS